MIRVLWRFVQIMMDISACRVFAAFENAKLPTPSLPTKSGSGIATPLTSYRWEMGPKLEMAEKWLAKWLAAIFRGGPNMSEKMAGQTENGQTSALRPWIFQKRPFVHTIDTEIKP